MSRVRVMLGLTVLTAAAAWALWPLPDGEPVRLDADVHQAAPLTTVAFDRSAFSTPLWVAPPALPPEPVPERSPPPPEPPRLQLLAIQGEGARAVMYDEAQDRVLSVGVGDAIAGCTVTLVTSEQVQLQNASGSTFTFRLEPAEKPR